MLQLNGELTVRVDLPGLNKDDVKVELTDGVLAISGERKEEKEENREGYYRSSAATAASTARYRYRSAKTEDGNGEIH